jgi:hypothetical protein
MERAIVGFQTDEVGDWVAKLECGHSQHVRHKPPFQDRPWTLTALGRANRVGTPLDCILCDEDSAPEALGLSPEAAIRPVWPTRSAPSAAAWMDTGPAAPATSGMIAPADVVRRPSEAGPDDGSVSLGPDYLPARPVSDRTPASSRCKPMTRKSANASAAGLCAAAE